MNVIEVGMFAALTAATDLTNELGGEYIYNPIAPQDQARPFVACHHVAGGPLNITKSDIRHHVYYLGGVADTPAQAGRIDRDIMAALHQQTLTVDGYTNYATWAEEEVQYVEAPRDGKPIFHRGHNYRIRIDS